MPHTGHPDYGHLLESGKYSDLTLVCIDKDFRVHKAVLCTQSPVIAAACDGSFEEASTSKIHCHDFETHAVQQMLTFMYTGHYVVSSVDEPSELSIAMQNLELSGLDYASLAEADDCTNIDLEIDEVDEGTSSAEIAGNTNVGSETGEANEKNSPNSMVLLIPHIKMNAIAEFYGIAELELRANAHIEELLNNSWTPNGFLDSVQEALKLTADKILHNLLATSMAEHIDELLDYTANEHIEDLELPGWLVVNVLRKVVAKQTEVHDRLLNHTQDLEVRLLTAEEELQDQEQQKKIVQANLGRLSAGISEFETLLRSTPICRNSSCDAVFWARMETKSSPLAGKFLLRCSKCRCRHS